MTHLPISKFQQSGMRSLFFIQIFSTLSYSVLYSTLILFITKGLHLDPDKAIAITGSFIAFNYFLHLLGGYIGGRYLSYRLLFCIGMLSQIFGCIILSLTSLDSMYWGLAVFLTGCGLNITCVNCMLTQLFESHDKNRETAFLWNYSGMNIGFLIGFTMSGMFQLTEAYSPLFLAAGIGNFIALLAVLKNWKVLKDKETHLSHTSVRKHFFLGVVGVLMLIALGFTLRWFLTHATFSNDFILVLGISMLVVVACLALQQGERAAAKKMWAFFLLLLSSLIFWTLYQMAPMGLTLFVIHNVDRSVLGFMVPPQWLLNVNTIIIIIGGPAMAYFYKKLRKRGVTIRIPIQFTLALFLIGIGFVILPIGIYFCDANGMTSFSWVVISYVFQSLGELFISPIGYAMIGQLVPSKMQGQMMGTWLMIAGIAATLSNYFSRMGVDERTLSTPREANAAFSETFNILGWSAIAGGIILLCLVPFLKRLIQEKSPHITPHPLNAPEDTPH